MRKKCNIACKYFSNGGCKNGDKCPFKHILEIIEKPNNVAPSSWPISPSRLDSPKQQLTADTEGLQNIIPTGIVPDMRIQIDRRRPEPKTPERINENGTRDSNKRIRRQTPPYLPSNKSNIQPHEEFKRKRERLMNTNEQTLIKDQPNQTLKKEQTLDQQLDLMKSYFNDRLMKQLEDLEGSLVKGFKAINEIRQEMKQKLEQFDSKMENIKQQFSNRVNTLETQLEEKK